MNKTITFFIAALELVEHGLRNIIAASDQLQEKLEKHRVEVAANEVRKHETNLIRLEDKLAQIELRRREAVRHVNDLAQIGKAEGRVKVQRANQDAVTAGFHLENAEYVYNEKASARGWELV